MQYVIHKQWIGLTAVLMFYAVACHQSGSDSDGSAISSDFGGNRLDVTGSITSQTGVQSQMQSWIVAMLERDNGTGRVSEADAGGNLKFEKASFSATQTLVLLSPDFLIQSVLTLPSTKAQSLRQYFQLGRTTLPRLVQRGAIISFQTLDGVSPSDYYAADVDSNGVPDGAAALGLVGQNGFQLSDADRDGIDDASDNDLDGDGMVNVFDLDDDNDNIPDVIDTDANGNSIEDSQEQNSDQHFAVGLNYVGAQVVITASGKSVRFVAKGRDGLTISGVKIRGAKSLFNGSTYSDTTTSSKAWDLTLADDGNNDDGAAGDLIFARQVTLASGLAPRSNQVVFFQVTVGSGSDAFVAEFPYMFPNVSTELPTTAYESSTRTVTLGGNPFGADLQDFKWNVTIKNSDGIKIYEGSLIAGTTRTAVIPANILVSGQTYTYYATAQLLEKVAGYAPVVVQSAEGSISN